jgi:uncharacterized protein YegP (UPF0339 family)
MGLLALVLTATTDAQPPKPGTSRLTFEIFKDDGGQFRWRLKAGNGEIIATAGQAFSTMRGARESVDRIQEGAGKGAYTAEVYQDNAQKHRWRLVAKNGQTVAGSSQGYSAKADCEKALELVKASAGGAKVVEAK